MMFGVCLRYANCRADAEDMLQDAFMRVLKNLDKFENTGPLGAWIRRVTVNSCLNIIRTRRKDTTSFEDLPPSLDITSHDEGESLEAKDLMRYVQELPEGYRTVFNLYAIEGYKHAEIGEMLGISENTSKSQLAKARKALQEKILKENYEKAIG